MRVLRLVIALFLGLCAVPVVIFLVTWGATKLVGCAIVLDEDTVCRVGTHEVGWLVDLLTGVGVYGAITSGFAAYLFAGWVALELAAIIVRGVLGTK